MSTTDETIQPQVKIIDILRRNTQGVHVSFEFFPPKTEAGDAKLREVLVELARQRPVFMDITYGAGGGTAQKTPEICRMMKNIGGIIVNMHLTCTCMDARMVDEALIFCLQNGIRNIVALRGDPPAGQEWTQTEGGFACALDLVRYIRRHYGDYFCLAVAGYPEGHPSKITGDDGLITPEAMQAELAYLKEKVDAGGDYIITQLFYDNSIFLRFVEMCRANGITCPILPGMLPMLNHGGFQRMTSLCKTFVPQAVRDRVAAIGADDDEAFRNFGIELTTNMCREILASGLNHIHMYTLNQTHSTLAVLSNLGLLKQ